MNRTTLSIHWFCRVFCAEPVSTSAENALVALREPYWRKFAHGRYLGYRRARDRSSWIARYLDLAGEPDYRSLGLGPADDVRDCLDPPTLT